MDNPPAGVAMRRLTAALVTALVLGCDGRSAPAALGEPVHVRGAQFIEGELPRETGGPAITTATTQNAIILAGQGGKLLAGRAGAAASSIAMRFADVGSGYWVFPLGGPDPQFPGELTWAATCDFAAAMPAGRRTLVFAAIDEHGRAGPRSDLPMCFASPVSDNLHACDPTRPPPEAVILLTWDSNVDLDIVIVAPDGREISAKTTPKGGADANALYVDRDSLAACAPDGLRAEQVVFPVRPTGRFTAHASLFDACGLPAVRFTLDVYEAHGEGAARTLAQTRRQSGRMISLDANGGRDRGLFVAEHVF
jgi:hypothetical protein